VLRVIENTHPLIVMRFPATIDAPTVAGLIRAFDRVLGRGERFGTVLDASAIRKLPGADERHALAEWLRDSKRLARERELSVAAAIIVPSAFVRAFVATMYFIRKPTAPQHLTATFGEGVEWVCRRLVEASVALSPDAEALRANAWRGEEPSL
jgi:hypothetical protein